MWTICKGIVQLIIKLLGVNGARVLEFLSHLCCCSTLKQLEVMSQRSKEVKGRKEGKGKGQGGQGKGREGGQGGRGRDREDTATTAVWYTPEIPTHGDKEQDHETESQS